MSLQHSLLEHLIDGRFHSGEQLAKHLGVTRAAVWKHIKALQTEYGLDIHAVTGKGYRLSQSIELLNRDVISQLIEKQIPEMEIETFLSISSTNRYLMKQATTDTSHCMAVFAEQQTSGRGRHGRQWISPFGGNLYFSILYQFNSIPNDMTGLSLAVGVAIVEFLRKNGVESATLKWPNDILIDGRKLCGILLEMHGESHGPYAVVIGVGLNMNMSDLEAAKIDQPWIALNQVYDIGLSRNELAAELLIYIMSALKEFEVNGLDTFRERWMQWDCYLGSEVQLQLGDREVTGIARGIDPQGALIIEPLGTSSPGQQQRFYSGEIKMRPVKGSEK